MITERRNKIFDLSYTVKQNGCWEWNGYITRFGYPHTSFRKSKNGESRIAAHRYSYERFKGPIPQGMHVCHNCPGGDNRACVNPDHLWIGTQLENNRDKQEKGTQCRGVTNGTHKLDENEVIEIRKKYLSGKCGPELAKEYNVSPGLIYHIKNGKIWKHLIEGDECERAKKIERHHSVKLTEQNVRNILLRYRKGESVVGLAKEFGVTPSMIRRIKNGKAWKHLQRFT